MIKATSIELFKNLAQLDYFDHYFDLHNDFNFEKLSYSRGSLLFAFTRILGKICITLEFTDVRINYIDYYFKKEVDRLAVDTIYRGRVELNGELIEISEDGCGYFYLEFYDTTKLEFWARGLKIEYHEFEGDLN